MHSQTNQPEHIVELFQTSISFKSSFSQHFFFHSGLQFSTKDADNDLDNSIVSDPCAVRHHGAWWYYSCSWTNLNGLYHGGPYSTSGISDGVKWVTFRGQYYSLKRTEMKLKPKL